MEKLDAYKQAKADLEFANEMCAKLKEVLDAIPKINVGNTISISADSSDKQYIYAISVLNNQINACKELGLDPKEFEESKANAIQLRSVSADRKAWSEYSSDLYVYMQKVHSLLDKNDLFRLLEAPVKP